MSVQTKKAMNSWKQFQLISLYGFVVSASLNVLFEGTSALYIEGYSYIFKMIVSSDISSDRIHFWQSGLLLQYAAGNVHQ